MNFNILFSSPIFWVVILLTVICFIIFVWRAIFAEKSLRSMENEIAELKSNPSIIETYNNSEKNLFSDKLLEYSHNIHKVPSTERDDYGSISSSYLSTVPAENIFHNELINEYMYDHSFRHVPGILTAVGIIGTFYGLIKGLGKFKFDSGDASKAIDGLQPLLQGVEEAFMLSGVAILCSVFFLLVTRVWLTRLYSRLSEIANQLDEEYRPIIGENYLQKLVSISEGSENSIKALKDVMVGEFKDILNNITDRQIASTMHLGEKISDTIAESVGKPINDMAIRIESSTNHNSENVTGMIESILVSITERLDNTFGQQFNGLNEQMNNSSSLMKSVQESLERLVQDIRKNSNQATDHLSDKIANLLDREEHSANKMREEMQALVNTVQNQMKSEQDLSTQTLEKTIEKLIGKQEESVDSLTKKMDVFAANFANSSEQQAYKSSQVIEESINNITNSVSSNMQVITEAQQKLMSQIEQQTNYSKKMVESIEQVTTKAISDMNTGAFNMSEAASLFENSGQQLSRNIGEVNGLIQPLISTSKALEETGLAVRRGFESYEESRVATQSQIETLSKLIINNQEQNQLASNLVEQMRENVNKLNEVAEDNREYLEGVDKAVKVAFESFAEQLIVMIQQSIKETDAHIDKGTNSLMGVVHELESMVSIFATKENSRNYR